MKQVKRMIGMLLAIVLLLGAIPMSADKVSAATTSSYSPYAKIKYSYSPGVSCGTIRYITQVTGGNYFNWNYWPASPFGGYAAPESECGTASISMALSYIGISKTPREILEAYNGYTQFIGWGGSTHTSMSASSISTATSNYINGKGKYSPPVIHLPGYSSAGHYVVVIGQISSNTYQILDPWNQQVTSMTINGTSASYSKSGKNINDRVDQLHQWYNPNAVYNGEVRPIGAYDIATGGENSVYVRGWAYDPDDTSKAVSMHVYINGKHVGSLAADSYRQDVNNMYGCGDYHGFSGDISYEVTSSGTHTVEVYALDLTYGVGGVYLGSKMVTITPDATPPVISNIVIEEDSEGYTITCDVEDTSEIDRAMFPTWTSYNGQDDLEGADGSWPDLECHRGTVSNGKATFRVNRSNHNNEYGEYRTDIYIYDIYGNGNMKSVTYTLEKHEHFYTEKITKQPTCIEVGVKTYSCDCGDSYTESVTALGHKYGSWTTVKAATCEVAGSEKRVCERCSNTETRSVTAKGHTYETVVTVPGCETTGYSTHTCKICGDSYTDSTTDALGHKLEKWTTVKEATCEEGGSEIRSCERCDYEEIRKTAVGDHKYKKVTTLPTCEESGYTTYTCKVCGYCYDGDEKEAIGHSFTNYISDNNATENFPGTKTAKCDRCNATDTIPETSEEVPETPLSKEVIRLAGSTRYDTGYVVADVLKETLGVDKFEAVVVATGKNFADALAGSYLAVQKNAPIILTSGKSDNVAQLHEYIKDNVCENGTVYILGGEAAVPESVEDISGYTVKRLAGSSRYDTSVEFAKAFCGNVDKIVVASGKNFPDGLCGGPLAAALNAPLILTKDHGTDAAVRYAKENTVAGGYVLGGTGALTDDTVVEVFELQKAQEIK